MAQAVIKNPEPVDAFTDSVIRKIDPKVFATLTPIQVMEVREAISASRPWKKHPLDVRGVVPLFFARYYFVLLMGRDRRADVQKREGARRQQSALAGGFLFFLFALSPIFLAALLGLYFIKADMGIDLVPDQHAWEVLKLW